jgi:hypothetical protein
LRYSRLRSCPILRSMDAIDKLSIPPPSKEFWWNNCFSHPIHRLRLQIASGQFEAARQTVQAILAVNRRETRDWSEQIYIEMIEQLWPRVEAGDLRGVAALLHDWESQFVEDNGLRALYEKTPFPFELSAAD